MTNSANQRCSWQYIRSRQNWQDSLGWVIYKNFKLCSYSLTQPLIGSGLYIIKIIKIKGWFFCYKIDPKMFWIAQMGDQSTKKIVRHKMPSSATILLAENWLLWKTSYLLCNEFWNTKEERFAIILIKKAYLSFSTNHTLVEISDS